MRLTIAVSLDVETVNERPNMDPEEMIKWAEQYMRDQMYVGADPEDGDVFKINDVAVIDYKRED